MHPSYCAHHDRSYEKTVPARSASTRKGEGSNTNRETNKTWAKAAIDTFGFSVKTAISQANPLPSRTIAVFQVASRDTAGDIQACIWWNSDMPSWATAIESSSSPFEVLSPNVSPSSTRISARDLLSYAHLILRLTQPISKRYAEAIEVLYACESLTYNFGNQIFFWAWRDHPTRKASFQSLHLEIEFSLLCCQWCDRIDPLEKSIWEGFIRSLTTDMPQLRNIFITLVNTSPPTGFHGDVLDGPFFSRILNRSIFPEWHNLRFLEKFELEVNWDMEKPQQLPLTAFRLSKVATEICNTWKLDIYIYIYTEHMDGDSFPGNFKRWRGLYCLRRIILLILSSWLLNV